MSEDAALDIAIEEDSLTWAKAILFAMRHRNEEVLQAKNKRGRPNTNPDHCPSGVSQDEFSMWQYFRTHPRDIPAMFFRALQITDKHKTPGMDEAARASEEKSIAEAEAILDAAIFEAAGYKA